MEKHPRTCAMQEHQSLLAMPEPREEVGRARSLPLVTLKTSRQTTRSKSRRASFMITTTSLIALARPKGG
jgi:hypothetical protein